MLTALLFFCPSKQRQNKIRLLTLLFLVYEIVIVCVFGFTINSITYITGPGVCIILLYSFYLFVKQVKFSIFHRKNHGRVLMLAAIVFDCSCYTLIYFFNYIEKTPYQNDVFKLYYISSIVSSILMAVGLQLMNKRMKELQALKITRKELAMFFNH
jgi:NADH:ubiquinone oxidoreductase subunit K